jgi:hypothetical protein
MDAEPESCVSQVTTHEVASAQHQLPEQTTQRIRHITPVDLAATYLFHPRLKERHHLLQRKRTLQVDPRPY